MVCHTNTSGRKIKNRHTSVLKPQFYRIKVGYKFHGHVILMSLSVCLFSCVTVHVFLKGDSRHIQWCAKLNNKKKQPF